MAHRCPDAGNPRRAVLADHDWLINQRGVATVEPFDGTQVHGVVWDVSDHDLAHLDRAESVPAHYRRDQMTVQTEDGPSDAWVYIDHRVNPGPPRPGYLEAHHRRGAASRIAAELDRLLTAMGSGTLAPAAITAHNACTAIAFRATRRTRCGRGQPVAVAVRLPGHPWRRAGGDDRRDRRAGRRRGRRVGVSAPASRPLSASPVVGEFPRGRVERVSRSSSTTST